MHIRNEVFDHTAHKKNLLNFIETSPLKLHLPCFPSLNTSFVLMNLPAEAMQRILHKGFHGV